MATGCNDRALNKSYQDCSVDVIELYYVQAVATVTMVSLVHSIQSEVVCTGRNMISVVYSVSVHIHY